MSGIPQELVQRLVQNCSEEAATRVEAELAVPATAEQATPEEMPRPIHPFLQRLAQPIPPVDDAPGPSTSSTQLPSAEEPAKPSISVDTQQTPAADLATKRRSALEAWPEVHDELRTSCAEFIRARSRMQATSEA